jgi:hypothetical protein
LVSLGKAPATSSARKAGPYEGMIPNFTWLVWVALYPCETREKTSKLKVQWIWKRIVQCILGISWRFVLDYRNDGSLISYVSHMFYITDSIMYTSRLMRMARIGVVVILVDDDMMVT